MFSAVYGENLHDLCLDVERLAVAESGIANRLDVGLRDISTLAHGTWLSPFHSGSF
jgi:hypothetical protein